MDLKINDMNILNGLMTIYMSDNLANEKDDFYNLTWTRKQKQW